MIAYIQTNSQWAFLYDEDNKIIKSEKLLFSGASTIAIAKLRTFAKRNGFEVK